MVTDRRSESAIHGPNRQSPERQDMLVEGAILFHVPYHHGRRVAHCSVRKTAVPERGGFFCTSMEAMNSSIGTSRSLMLARPRASRDAR